MSVFRGYRKLWSGALVGSLVAFGGCEQGSILDSTVSGSSVGSDTESVFALFSGPTPQDAVQWAIDANDPDKRVRGTLLLANAPWGGEDVYQKLYRAALDDEDAGVRAVAIRALAMHGAPEDAPRLIKVLENGNDLLREEAARALQRIHAAEAVPALLEHADARGEENRKVRRDAVIALGQYAESRVVSRLVDALNDRDLSVNRAARRSLRILTGQDFGLDARAWLTWTGQSEGLFAGRGEYEYPAFNRDPSLLEMIVPWMEVPNEIAAAPVGMARANTGGSSR